ncbi:MAG TPA: MFS transporter [Mycobacteriales bacterium]|nr:MFS transporter [Mycobacteriales bacterium]
MRQGTRIGAARDAPADGIILALVCLAQFMVILDVSIVNVALPSIRSDLHFSPIGLQWVVNAYTLTFAGFLLLGGRAADLLGQRRVFLAGLGLFTAASLVGGFAPNGTALLIARSVQGLGGAVLSPATLTVLMSTFPEGPRRAKAIGLWSALAGAGGATGAVFGGLLTAEASWRWILFVNVPIGAVGLVAARVFLRGDPPRQPVRGRLDLPGAVLVTAGLVVAVYGIVSTDQHPWGSGPTLLTLAAAAALLLGFFIREARYARQPLMPLRVFRSRSVTGANVVMLGISGAVFATWYFLSLYMQNVLGYSPAARRGRLPAAVAGHHRRRPAQLAAGEPDRGPAAAAARSTVVRHGLVLAVAPPGARQLRHLLARGEHADHFRHRAGLHPDRGRRHLRGGPCRGGAGVGAGQHQPPDRRGGGVGGAGHGGRGPSAEPARPGSARRPVPGGHRNRSPPGRGGSGAHVGLRPGIPHRRVRRAGQQRARAHHPEPWPSGYVAVRNGTIVR